MTTAHAAHIMDCRRIIPRLDTDTSSDMSSDARDIARKLARIQSRLRKELLSELNDHEDNIDQVFDPYSYSPVVQELREKYLSRLYVLQAILQELAHCNTSRRQPPVKVLSVNAEDSDELVKRVNKQLVELNGAKVLDVKFLQNKQDDHWVGLITYLANPFTATTGETPAMM